MLQQSLCTFADVNALFDSEVKKAIMVESRWSNMEEIELILNGNKTPNFESVNSINAIPLIKLAYMKCNEKEKSIYNDLQSPKIDVKKCCILLMERSSATTIEAIKYKHFECYKRGHKCGMKLPFWSCKYAASNGDLDILKYAFKNGCDLKYGNICEDAARNGNVDCLKYVHENGGVITKDVIKYTIRYGNLDCLNYVIKNGGQWTNKLCALSACSGDLNFVKYCRQQGCPWVVTSSWDWYIVGSTIKMLQVKNKRVSVADKIDEIHKCIHYIESTAKIGRDCKFVDNVGVKKLKLVL